MVHRGLTIALSHLLKQPCVTKFNACARMSDWYSKPMNNLRNLGLDNINHTNATLAALVDKFEKLTVPALKFGLTVCTTLDPVQPPATVGLHPLPASSISLKAHLDGATNQYEGLCLDCVRTGGKFDGKCRVKHI